MTLLPLRLSGRASTRRREQYTFNRVCSRPFAFAEHAGPRALAQHESSSLLLRVEMRPGLLERREKQTAAKELVPATRAPTDEP